MEDGDVFLRALSDHNPTLVNGQPVMECVLHTGDEIGVGPALFVLSETQEGQPPIASTVANQPTVSIRSGEAVFYFEEQR